MKKLLKVFTVFAGIVILLGVVIVVRGDTYLFKALWACYLHGYSGPVISDARFFDTHHIEAAEETWDWHVGSSKNHHPLPEKLQSIFTQTGTAAFLVIQNDSILSEHYWDGYSDSSLSNSFSMAKSITTMLAQIAIQKRILQGWNQKVMTLLPELKGANADKVELWHLSTMSSGLGWDESYSNPWSVSAKSYYGEDISKLMLTLPIKTEPGREFNYQSGSTELLAMCLIKATGKPLSELASEWLWKPLGARYDAKWHTDSKGTELAFCCFNSNASDFARFGKLMLNQGNWNGTQILDSSFVQSATVPALDSSYGYSFWLDETQGTKTFFQWGLGGQYIICVPEYNLIIVRLGNNDLTTKENLSEYERILVREVLGMLKGEGRISSFAN